jgi:3-deoxy-D-arabino-heptulosonate 7-phosphate (DAHP) synthase
LWGMDGAFLGTRASRLVIAGPRTLESAASAPQLNASLATRGESHLRDQARATDTSVT